MQPFFKSESNDILPFSTVTGVKATIESSPRRLDIFTIHNKTYCLYFNHVIDKETQLKNYENYLINQYKLKELL